MRITAQNPIIIKQQLADFIGNLKVGDTVRGRIIEAFANSISVKAASGQIFTAALMKAAELNIGQVVELNINSITEQGVFAELKTSNQKTIIGEDSKLLQSLRQMNIEPTDSNLQAAKLLMKNNMPVTKENLVNLVNTQKSIEILAQGDASKAVALLQSELSIENTEFTQLVKITAAMEPQSREILNTLQKDAEAVKEALKLSQQFDAEQRQNDQPITKQVQAERVQAETIQVKLTQSEQAQAKQPQEILKQADLLKSIELMKSDETQRQTEIQKAAVESNPKLIMQQLTSNIDADAVKREAPMLEKLIDTITDVFKAASKAKPEETAYLLAKDIKITPAAVKALTENITGGNKLSKQLEGLEKLAEQLEKNQVDIKEIKQELSKSYLKPEQLQDKEKLAENIKDIVKAADKLETVIREKGLEGKVDTAPLQELKNNLDLIKNINTNINYLQIPVQINENKTTAEIYVYKGNKRSKNINPENATILIALDLDKLGHIESLISVYKKNVDITFKVEKEDLKAVISNSSQSLMTALEARGYSPNPLKIIDIKDRFNLVELEEMNYGASGQFSVDIRV